MQKKQKETIAIISFIILSFAFIFGIPKPSEISKFPVPITAKVEKVYSEDSFDYRYLGSNQFYMLRLRLYGWKQIDQMGAVYFFEKNGEVVSVLPYQNGFNITAESSIMQP